MFLARSSLFLVIVVFISMGWTMAESARGDSPIPSIALPNSSSASENPSDDISSQILDVRVRPYALLSQTPGAEFGFVIGSRFELGPTVHYFNNDNEVRGSSVNSWEFGLKSTYLLWKRSFREGVFVSGTYYEYLSQVTQNSPSASTGHFFVPGYALTTGYQWLLHCFHSDRWTLRFGGGLSYRQEHLELDQTSDGSIAPLGTIKRVQPTLELTLGAFI